MRPFRRMIAAGAAIALLAVLVPSVAAASPRSGGLQITKECSQYTHKAGGFCTITSSNLAAIPVGSKVVYLEDLVGLVLETDVVLDPPGPGNNMAFGHVHLDLVTGIGQVTFSGGTGKFTWFSGSVAVTRDAGVPFGWRWDGTYAFSPPED